MNQKKCCFIFLDTEIDVNEYADTEDCMVDNSEQPPSSLILVNPFDTSGNI